MSQSFRTISKPTEGIFKDRGFRFLAYAFPITGIGQVKSHLEILRSEHPSAHHVCYAYQLGTEGNDYRANDDGEPSGTAGLPIINQIKSKEITNVLIAVVRYFGGTKLGVSGLINAYKEAARDALSVAKVVEKIPMAAVSIRFPHYSIGAVERVVRQFGWQLKNQEFGVDCRWEIGIPIKEKQKAEDTFGLLTHLTHLNSLTRIKKAQPVNNSVFWDERRVTRDENAPRPLSFVPFLELKTILA